MSYIDEHPEYYVDNDGEVYPNKNIDLNKRDYNSVSQYQYGQQTGQNLSYRTEVGMQQLQSMQGNINQNNIIYSSNSDNNNKKSFFDDKSKVILWFLLFLFVMMFVNVSLATLLFFVGLILSGTFVALDISGYRKTEEGKVLFGILKKHKGKIIRHGLAILFFFGIFFGICFDVLKDGNAESSDNSSQSSYSESVET